MRLLHLHLPKPILYSHSLDLQEAFLQKHFAYNANIVGQKTKGRSSGRDKVGINYPPPPPPLLLTFQTFPTYTVGRRHLTSNPLTRSQIDFLTATDKGWESNHDATGIGATDARKSLATFYASPRGGLLTYHAPGQLTAYLIYNLRYHNITPRCHIRMLENAVMATCDRHGVQNTLTTNDPGVWIGEKVDDHDSQGSHLKGDVSKITKTTTYGRNEHLRATNRKICAIGVHVSRGITSHGIGLNLFDSAIPVEHAGHYRLPTEDVPSGGKANEGSRRPHTSQLDQIEAVRPQSEIGLPATGYLSWGFSRITACGLEGKSVTWLSREQAYQPTEKISVEEVANTLASELASGLSATGSKTVDEVQKVTKDHIQRSDYTFTPTRKD